MSSKFAVKMTLEYIDSNKNKISEGSILVGRADTIQDARNLVDSVKYTYVDSHIGFNTEGNVYKKKRVDSIPYTSYHSESGNSITENIKSIEIIEI